MGALNDVNNEIIPKVNPSQPARIIGFKSLPKAGDPIVSMQSEGIAKEILSRRKCLRSYDNRPLMHRREVKNSPLKLQVTGMETKRASMTRKILSKYNIDYDTNNGNGVNNNNLRIPVLVKADTDATLAAVQNSLIRIADESTLDLTIDLIGVGVGQITVSDVRMAQESGAAIFCFNLKGTKDKGAMALAEKDGVTVASHNVIYNLLDEAKDIFSKYFPPKHIEIVHGTALIQEVFDINNRKKSEKIAGLRVEDGVLYLDKTDKECGSLVCEYRVKRRGKLISSQGLRAKSLRRVNENVKDVQRGTECGLCLAGHNDLEVGDIVECFSTEIKYTFI